MAITLNETAMEAARAAYNNRYAPTFRVLSEAIRAYLAASRNTAPVAYAYVIEGECEEITWGELPADEDPCLVLLYAAPEATLASVPAPSGAAEADRPETIADNPKSWIAWKREAEALRRKLEEHRKALEPFADVDITPVEFERGRVSISIEWIQDARRTLSGASE